MKEEDILSIDLTINLKHPVGKITSIVYNEFSSDLEPELFSDIHKAVVKSMSKQYDEIPDNLKKEFKESNNFCNCDLPNYIGLYLDKAKPCPYCKLLIKPQKK